MTHDETTEEVIFLNPFTCGIYKDGGIRYKIDPRTGERTDQVDNELGEQVDKFIGGVEAPGVIHVPLEDVFGKRVIVPRYYDTRWLDDFHTLLAAENLEAVSLGELKEVGIIKVRGGHGSPSNDRRSGHIPYVKVSDIRSLRININPTNLVTDVVARKFWKGSHSGLHAWDLITPNRASSNIGEFAVLLPGEEQVVLTKEVFVIRVTGGQEQGWDPFYLLWALCLKAVRKQWGRVVLMQTNREDVGNRYQEIYLPKPRSQDWARAVSAPFRDYFTTLATARTRFLASLTESGYEYIASAHSVGSMIVELETQEAADDEDEE
jgi:type I restriction enzyme M protein